MGLLLAELNPLVAELSEANKSPNRSGPEACRDEATLEPTPEPDPIPNGSNRSLMAETIIEQNYRDGNKWKSRWNAIIMYQVLLLTL